MFVKKATAYENGMTHFVFIFSKPIKCEEWKKLWHEKMSYFVWRLPQCMLNKVKLTTWKSDCKNMLVDSLFNFHFTFVND